MKASEFHKVHGEDADYWADDPKFPSGDWMYEVENGDTRLGYWDWVAVQEEQAEEEE